MPYCWKCKTAYAQFKKTPDIHARCDKCQSYWHSCCNCRFFTGYPSARCTVANIEPANDVEGANFCDEFQLAGEPPGSKQANKADEARQKWNDLFRD